MKFLIEYVVTRTIVFILQFLPLSLVSRIGSGVGWFIHYVIPIRRTVAHTNLRIAFPEKSQQEIKKICRNTYRNFGMTFLEYLCLSSMPQEKLGNLVKFSPPRLLHDLMAQNKGCIGVTAHFSSFELMGVSFAHAGIPVDIVVKAMKNPYVEKLVDSMRSKTKIGVIKVKDGFGMVSKSIAQKKVVGLVADQNAGSKGIFVPFFGVESSTPAGPAILAVRSNAPMFVSMNIRTGRAAYRAEFQSISYENLPEKNDEKIREITMRYTSVIESYIRQYPDQYFWMHKRWKTAGIY